MAILVNVMQVACVDANTERLKIRLSKVDKIPQNLENIVTRLPQLEEAVKQIQNFLRPDWTKEAEQETLWTEIETCKSRLEELAKIVPRVSTSSGTAQETSEELLLKAENKRVDHISQQLELHVITMQSYHRQRTLARMEDTASHINLRPPDFIRIEENKAQLKKSRPWKTTSIIGRARLIRGGTISITASI